jgi:hypothetical protein
VYGNLVGKTLLMPSALAPPPDSIVSDLPAEKTNAIARIENEFLKNGIIVVQDGPSFARLLPQVDSYSLTNPPLRGAQLAAAQSAQSSGMINFLGTDLNQVLQVYANVRRRTILRPVTLPLPVIRLTSQRPLTLEEMSYAIETVAGLNGVAMVDDGEKFVQVVPWFERSQVTAGAPKAGPDEKLFDPKEVPSLGDSNPMKPQTRVERELQRIKKALYDFFHYKGPQDRPARRLLELYAGLTDKRTEPSKEFGARPIWFHIEAPLTKRELLYAIETTFKLNGLLVVPVDENRIRLDPLAQTGRNKVNPESKAPSPNSK